VALVHDDQGEEIGLELAVDVLVVLVSAHRLVEGKVDFVGVVDLLPPARPGARIGDLIGVAHRQIDLYGVRLLQALLVQGELGHRPLEGFEVVDHRLVDQDVPVRQVEDALLRL
jgi:hypothetical protein